MAALSLFTKRLFKKSLSYDDLLDCIVNFKSDQLDKILNVCCCSNKEEAKSVCNLRNEFGTTLLMQAVYYGNQECLNILLKYGADASDKDKKGRTSLFYSIPSTTSNKIEIFKSLIKAKCPIDEEDMHKTTCLHEAVKSNQIELVKILLEENADRNKADYEGISPLHRAVDNGNLEIIKLLLKKNCNVNHTDKSGWTCLHVASLHNDLEIVKFLLVKGANINAKDHSATTPLAFARLNNSREVINYLKKNGAKEFNIIPLSKEIPFYDDLKNMSRIESILMSSSE